MKASPTSLLVGRLDTRLAEALVLRFEAGHIVDARAASDADPARALIATDPGACVTGKEWLL
jgi:leucyl aminopeptidase (aminopeptidase T)